MFSFVETHDFGGKPVFLLMTGNSRLTEERTDKFRVLLELKKGRFLDKLFIRRGRIFWQKSPEQVYEEVRAALEARQDMWAGHKLKR